MLLVSAGSEKPGEDRHDVAGSLMVAVLLLLVVVLREGLLA